MFRSVVVSAATAIAVVAAAPLWVTDLCATEPCNISPESYGVVKMSVEGNEHWFAFKKSDGTNDVFQTGVPIYGPSNSLPNFVNTPYAHGGVVGLGLLPPVPQQPQFPSPDSAATQAWFSAACALDPTCGAGGLTQAEFDALLAGSSYMGHNHSATLIINGVSIPITIGLPQ